MKTVKNIKKITSAMKLVAASKLRRAEADMRQSRHLVAPLVAMIPDEPGASTASAVTVPVTSDRGLCGGINSGIARAARATHLAAVDSIAPADASVADSDAASAASAEEDSSASVPGARFLIVGEKGRALLQRGNAQDFLGVVSETAKTRLTFATASEIAAQVCTTRPAAVRVLFNKFETAISYQPTVATALAGPQLLAALGRAGAVDGYLWEGPPGDDEASVADDLAEFHLAATLYNALLENSASENASRMQAMESSTKNASEMIDKLSITYNRARQASITTELIEIISGASALEG